MTYSYNYMFSIFLLDLYSQKWSKKNKIKKGQIKKHILK